MKGSGDTRPLSAALEDWYSATDSNFFVKEELVFKNTAGKNKFYMDASEFGDLLVLSGASYSQGIEKSKNEIRNTLDTCGQATVFSFMQTVDAKKTEEAFNIPAKSANFYGFISNGKSYTTQRIWEYRQLMKGSKSVTLQNWNPGNDYPFGYVFKSKSQVDLEKTDWAGGSKLSDSARR